MGISGHDGSPRTLHGRLQVVTDGWGTWMKEPKGISPIGRDKPGKKVLARIYSDLTVDVSSRIQLFIHATSDRAIGCDTHIIALFQQRLTPCDTPLRQLPQPRCQARRQPLPWN